MAALLALGACSAPRARYRTGEVSVNDKTRVVVDQAGRTVEISGRVERIVSCYYISTSACIALGLAGKMVGIEAKAESRSIYALVAPGLLQLPNVGTAKDFNLEACIALAPDLVVAPLVLRDKAEIMADMGVPVILVDPEGYDEMLEMIALVGKAAGVPDSAERLIAYYGEKRASICAITEGFAEKPVVYMCGVGSYLTTAPLGMYQSELIEFAGGQNAAQKIDGRGWTQVSYEQLLAMDPEFIIIPSEASYDKEDILDDEQLAALSAVKNGKIYSMPKGFEAWDSPVASSILGILWLLCVLHGDAYPQKAFTDDIEVFFREFYGVSVELGAAQ